MKNNILEPKTKNDEVVIQFTDTFVLDKSIMINIPNQYIAIVFDNEKIAFRIEPCVEKSIYKEYGKEYLGHKIQIAFIHVKAIPEIIWGFGNIQVNNDRLKEAYRVGANGTMQVQITDYAKFVNSFSHNSDVTIDVVKEKVFPVIKMTGSNIISSRFAYTDISAFEINAELEKIRDEMLDKIVNEDKFRSMGIKILSLIVNKIHVNEEDLELIRNRINSSDNQEVTTKKNIDIEAEFEKLSKKFSEKVSNEIRESEKRTEKSNKQQIAEEIQKNQKDMIDSLMGKISNQLEEFGKIISYEFDERIQEMLPLYDNAKEDYIKEIKLTAENLIKSAKTDEDLIPAAAIMYSNIEYNLIAKFKLKHENRRFIIDYKDYLRIADIAKIGDKYLLKRKNNDGTFSIIRPRVVKFDKNNEPLIVEMTPVVRFLKAGISVSDTKFATEIWTALNKIRHKSTENEKELNEICARAKMTRKEYLLNALSFYKKLGLYTKD